MKILVTGAKGFVGKNLCGNLRARGYENVYEFDLDSPSDDLEKYAKDCDFVFNLAGVNRPKDKAEFMQGNRDFADRLLMLLAAAENKCPVMLSSSIQAKLDNDYGKSKKAGEDLLFEYSKQTGAKAYVYRFPNLFGKWCRPNYNSAVATFCNNIARDLPITVNDENIMLDLVYIDDLVDEMLLALEGKPHVSADGYCFVPVDYKRTLGDITRLLRSFRESRKNLSVPNMNDDFTRKLYAAYLSYLPENSFSYALDAHVDARGSFTEMLRLGAGGQVSVNVARPKIVKGNHWHNTKNEKFLVVSGEAIIRFRKIGEDNVTEYRVSGDKPEVVDIPTGFTHNIENVGEKDLITIMWASECYNPEKPDTIFEKV